MGDGQMSFGFPQVYDRASYDGFQLSEWGAVEHFMGVLSFSDG
jgi:hypothetical protein